MPNRTVMLRSLLLLLALDNAQATTWRFVCEGTTISGALMPSGDVSAGHFPQFKGDLCRDDPGSINQYWVCTDCIQRCPDRLELLSMQSLIISKDKVPNNLKVGWFQTNIIANVGGTCMLTDQGPDNSEGSTEALKSFSKTSVLFVSISFIILMVISLAWLVFYYVQRFRYAHAKDRLQRRLFNAARKALARIPTRPVRSGDDELETDCPVCLDPYQLHDIARILPCKHVYHKSCIDPWLLEHRTCPMCKADILKYFGYQYYDSSCMRPDDALSRTEIGESRAVRPGSVRVGSPEVTSTSSESNGFSFEPSDPETSYAFSSNVPPQLVLNATNAKSFVPMTSRVGTADSKKDASTSNTNASYSARAALPTTNQEPSTSHRKRTSSVSIQASTSAPLPNLSTGTQTTQGQIVNLVQVQTRAATATRAATLRKESSNKPTPVETTLSRSVTSTETQVV